jgi:hypothetical protein
MDFFPAYPRVESPLNRILEFAMGHIRFFNRRTKSVTTSSSFLSGLRPFSLFLLSFLSIFTFWVPSGMAVPFSPVSEALVLEFLESRANRRFLETAVSYEDSYRHSLEEQPKRPTTASCDCFMALESWRYTAGNDRWSMMSLSSAQEEAIKEVLELPEESAFDWIFPLFSRPVTMLIDAMVGLSFSRAEQWRIYPEPDIHSVEWKPEAGYPEYRSEMEAYGPPTFPNDADNTPDYSQLFSGPIRPLQNPEPKPPMVSGSTFSALALLFILMPDMIVYIRERF